MFLSGVLFVLFLAGCWLYCLTDAALTPAWEFRGWPKRAWIVLIAATFILGAIAWIAYRRYRAVRYWYSLSWRSGHWPSTVTASRATALARHPAGRDRQSPAQFIPRGPDDDEDFLRQLDRQIRGLDAG